MTFSSVANCLATASIPNVPDLQIDCNGFLFISLVFTKYEIQHLSKWNTSTVHKSTLLYSTRYILRVYENNSAHLRYTHTHTHTHSPRNDSHLPRVISSFEQSIQVPHNFLKRIAHEVQRAVGEDD